jgi:hypothetical protein
VRTAIADISWKIVGGIARNRFAIRVFVGSAAIPRL